MLMPEYRIYEVLKQGVSDAQVKCLQRTMPLWASEGTPLVADGIFGTKTTTAVKNFQTAMNLTSDGIVGRATGVALRLWVDIEKGFDASHYNNIAWDKIDTNVYTFANLKATEGSTYTDPKFDLYATSALSRGLELSVYHYTKFKNPPEKELENLTSATSKFSNDIHTYYLDLEERNTNFSSAQIFEWVDRFLTLASARFGLEHVGVYTSSNYLREKNLQGYQQLSKYSLWAADWKEQPLVTPWGCWDTWQYTSKGSVSWCEGPIDLNLRCTKPR